MKKNSIGSLLALSIIVFVATGCGMLKNSEMKTMNINSSSNSTVMTNNTNTLQTPSTNELSSKVIAWELVNKLSIAAILCDLKGVESSDSADKKNSSFETKPQTKLRADKESGTIAIDSITTLTGVPVLAWEYKLGNRSAIEWILDQYKEKTPQDATIRERFNTYQFADYKEQVIDLLVRVCNVSVRTMEIINLMPDK